MLKISSSLKNMYQNGATFKQTAKLQVLDRNYKLLDEFTDEIIDGQVTIDNSRSSLRNFSLKLSNKDGTFTWGSNNLIWLDKLFKIWIGVYVNGSIEWLPQGVFPCTSPIATSVATGNSMYEVTLQGPDKMSFLGELVDNLTVSKGTAIGTAIQSVLSGIETMFLFDDTSNQPTIPYDMTWGAGTHISKVISDIAAIITWELYYDVNGYLRLHAPIDPTVTPPAFSFSSDATSFNLWAGADRHMDDSALANYIVVYGGSSQTQLVSYTLQDNNAMSPTSIQAIGRRTYLHNNGNPDPVITTSLLAQARAEYEYKKRLQVVEKLNFKVYPMPFMEQDDVYEIDDSHNGTSGKYQVMSATIPLRVRNNGFQTGYVWQVRNFA